ncbi:hypothetical protein [Cytobacillus oceanisediminis]|uniref:hypothetical protein n=1 Tax=Cytobacillus oceanisediminis TaxID=665099 RepID=UPI003736BB98
MYRQFIPYNNNYYGWLRPASEYHNFLRETRAPIVGTSSDSGEAAVFGSNEATTPPTGGGAGGSGVFGLSVSPGAAGVFGANNSTKGVGVQGNGPEAGISGFSDRGAGVRAHSNHGNGVEGFAHDANGAAILAINNATTAPTVNDGSPRGSGVLGMTTVPDGAGVFGANNSTKGRGVQGNGPEAGVGGFSEGGNGVLAQSKTGIGILAQGGRLAGKFEGNVEVTGNLNVNGFIYMGGDTVTPLGAWLSRIRQLEAEVADLRSRLPVSGTFAGSTTTTPSATVDVEMIPRTGPFNDLRVFGSGFLPNEPIEITYNSTPEGGNSGTTEATADSLGRFSNTIGVSCSPGIRYTAYARGKQSGRISNTAGASC